MVVNNIGSLIKPSVNRLNLDQELACLGPCDMTLVVKDGKQFQVHRNVLLQASPFFEKLLSSDMKESNKGVIRLPKVTGSQMADILKFTNVFTTAAFSLPHKKMQRS